MDANRIAAPQRVLDALQRLQTVVERLQAEANGVVFGAAAALDVPDGWRWDGAGWVAPEASVQAPEPPNGG